MRAYGDFSSEGERNAGLQHLVVSDDPAYDGMAVNTHSVRMIDDDRAGVVVLETGNPGGRGLKPTPARIAVMLEDAPEPGEPRRPAAARPAAPEDPRAWLLASIEPFGSDEDRRVHAWMDRRGPGPVMHLPIADADFGQAEIANASVQLTFHYATLLHGQPTITGGTDFMPLYVRWLHGEGSPFRAPARSQRSSGLAATRAAKPRATNVAARLPGFRAAWSRKHATNSSASPARG